MPRLVLYVWLALGIQAGLTGLNPDWSVLFPDDRATALLQQCSRSVPEFESTWTPDEPTLRRFERALGPALQKRLDETLVNEAYQQQAADFYRQYVGLVVEGRRLVYANGFHRSHLRELRVQPPRPPVDWQRVPVNVCDGWTSYFGAVYDPLPDKVTQILFNGRAFLTGQAFR
jgi:hypothetical protein